MLYSLGFDTLIISYDRSRFSDFKNLMEHFYSLGIKNFIFIFDYDPTRDTLVQFSEKFNGVKKYCSQFASRRMKIKCAFNLNICRGAAFNSSVTKLYADKSSKSIFVGMPIFTDRVYDSFATDINHLLYRKSAFTVFSFFDLIIETAGRPFCKKFITNPHIGITLDVNYLFNPKNQDVFNEILKSNCLLIPTVSGDISNYAGVGASAEYALNLYGKNKYYKLCSQINKCSVKFGF